MSVVQSGTRLKCPQDIFYAALWKAAKQRAVKATICWLEFSNRSRDIDLLDRFGALISEQGDSLLIQEENPSTDAAYYQHDEEERPTKGQQERDYFNDDRCCSCPVLPIFELVDDSTESDDYCRMKQEKGQSEKAVHNHQDHRRHQSQDGEQSKLQGEFDNH